MTSPANAPRTLAGWLTLLDRTPLPITAAERDRLIYNLRDNRRSLRELADLLQATPAAALALMRSANRQISSLSEGATSLEAALTRLGLEQTEQLVRRLPCLAAEQIPQALRQLWLISQHAEQLSSALFGPRLARLWQELNCASLLFLAPLWPLALVASPLLEQWNTRVYGLNQPAHLVEQELFGVSLAQLAGHLAERWQLPGWISQGYRLIHSEQRLLAKALRIAKQPLPLLQQQQLDQSPELRHQLIRPETSALLACGLALGAHQAWGGAHSLRWQRLSALYLQCPLEDLQQQLHQHSVTSARRLNTPDLWHPAQALLWPWAEQRWRPPAQPVAPQATTPKEVAEWRAQCALLLQAPSAFANVLQLTACIGAALRCGGFNRQLLLLADRQHSRLKAQFSLGLSSEAARLQLDPRNSQVLRKLLEQPTQLQLTPDNWARYSAFLPGELKTLFGGEHLILRSFAAGERVVLLAVIACHDTAPNAMALQILAKTNPCIGQALSCFARRKS